MTSRLKISQCGHGSFSPYSLLNDTLGFVRIIRLIIRRRIVRTVHRFFIRPLELLTIVGNTPIANITDSMAISRKTSSTYLAKIILRSKKKDLLHSYIPKIKDADQTSQDSGFWDAIEDTPIFQVIKLAFQQIFGFQSYLLLNVSGQARYPGWTSHFNRTSTPLICLSPY